MRTSLAIRLVLAIAAVVLPACGAQGALYEITASATGTVSVDGAPPGPPGTITITAIADTSRAVNLTPHPSLPFWTATSWPLERLSFSAPGVSGDYLAPGSFEHSFFSPSTHGAWFTAGGPHLALFAVPMPPSCVSPPAQFSVDIRVYSAPRGTRALTSAHTVEYRYTDIGSESMRFTAALAPIPEPGTLALLLTAIAAPGISRNRAWRAAHGE